MTQQARVQMMVQYLKAREKKAELSRKGETDEELDRYMESLKTFLLRDEPTLTFIFEN